MILNWQIKAAMALVAVLGAGYAGHLVTHNHWQAKWSERDAADAVAQSQVYAEAHEKQQKLSEELKHAYEIAKNMQDQREADRIAAADTSRRLRDEIARHKTSAINHPSTISSGANTATDRLVLVNVLERADEAAGALADYADRNRQAVINCNNEYQALQVLHVRQTKR
jgi:hypothetical protein